MDKQQFHLEIAKIYKGIPVNFFDNIEKYKELIFKFNETTNLTSFDNDRIYDDFFYESIIPYKNIDFKKYPSVLDIGSGAGIPGILLKLLFPFIELTIIEANSKKNTFLNLLIKELNLKDVVLLNQRAEEINFNDYETFDLVTSRAVAPLRIIMEISTPYCKVNGLIVQPKSKNYLNEQKDFDKLINELHLRLIKIESFYSATNHEHNVFIYEKTRQTNRKFPRK